MRARSIPSWSRGRARVTGAGMVMCSTYRRSRTGLILVAQMAQVVPKTEQELVVREQTMVVHLPAVPTRTLIREQALQDPMILELEKVKKEKTCQMTARQENRQRMVWTIMIQKKMLARMRMTARTQVAGMTSTRTPRRHRRMLLLRHVVLLCFWPSPW